MDSSVTRVHRVGIFFYYFFLRISYLRFLFSRFALGIVGMMFLFLVVVMFLPFLFVCSLAYHQQCLMFQSVH